MGRLVSEGKSVKVNVPENTTIEQGKFYLLDGFLGMAVQSVTTGAGETAKVVLNIQQGEYETSQIDTADTFAAGDKAYWDVTNKRFTTVAADGFFAGVVTAAKDANNVIWMWFAPQQAVLRQAATVAAITDSTEGTADGTLADVGAAFDQATINNNFAEVAAKINGILTALKDSGLMA